MSIQYGVDSIMWFMHDLDYSLDERLRIAERVLENAQQLWYAQLPDFPADGQCECGNPGSEFGAWQHVESGYIRWTSGNATSDGVRVVGDGWDDMSEGGTLEWMECQSVASYVDDHVHYTKACGRCYKVPDNLEWD